MSQQKNTTSQIRLPLLLALSIAGGIWIGATFAEPKGSQNDLRAALYKLQEIMTYINRDYVDTVNQLKAFLTLSPSHQRVAEALMT